jgi:hypothetical protein
MEEARLPSLEPFDADPQVGEALDAKRYLIGYYKGTVEKEGQRYHAFHLPDPYRGAKSRSLELIVPVAECSVKGRARVRELDRPASGDRPVIARFAGSTNKINPKYISRHFGPLDAAFSTQYPGLLSISVRYKLRVRMGRLLKPNEHLKATPERHPPKYEPICDTTQPYENRFNFYKGILENADPATCSWWLWSETYTAEGYPGAGVVLDVLEAAGYLVTFPVDVVTSPLQLIYLGAVAAVISYSMDDAMKR